MGWKAKWAWATARQLSKASEAFMVTESRGSLEHRTTGLARSSTKQELQLHDHDRGGAASFKRSAGHGSRTQTPYLTVIRSDDRDRLSSMLCNSACLDIVDIRSIATVNRNKLSKCWRESY